MSNAHSNQPLYIQSGDPETVSDSPTKIYAIGQAGKYVTVKQPGPAGSPAGQAEDYRDKTYRYVLTDSTMSTAPYVGALAWWADKSRYKVTTSPTATNRAQVAGVFCNATTLGNWVFVQTSGPGTVKFVDAPTAAIAVGTNVIPSATTGKADNIAAGTATGWPIIGYVASDPAAPTSPSGNAAAMTYVVDLFIPEQP